MEKTSALTEPAKTNLLWLQQLELDGHYTYLKLSGMVKDENSRLILQRIAGEEKKHYEVWRHYTLTKNPYPAFFEKTLR